MGGGEVCCYNATFLPACEVLTEPNSNISMFKAILLVFQAFKLFQFVFVIVMCQRLLPIFIYKHRHIQSGPKRQYGPDDKVPKVLRA